MDPFDFGMYLLRFSLLLTYFFYVALFLQTVIDSESGTLAMSSTEFSYNVVSDDLGYVELGVGSTLEANDNNCDKSTSGGASSDGTVSDTSTGTFVSARQGLISTVTGDDATPAITTEGSDVTTGNSTDDSNVTSVSTTEGGNVTSASLTEGDVAQVSSKCIGISANGICVEQFGASCAAEGGGLEGCFSNWDELVNAVRDRSQTDPDFMICPNTTLEVGDNPVMIDSDYTTIKCGADGLRSDNCVISRGFSHFHITGSPADVELLGLTMEASWGSSIIAAGTSESTLRLNDCGWNVSLTWYLVKSFSAILIDVLRIFDISLLTNSLMQDQVQWSFVIHLCLSLTKM